ncbi:MAG: peptidase, partial [Clostridia bacterium]|nr:peptidase [Clostridia bacterium]
ARIARAEGEARAIYLSKKAEADGLKVLKEAGADAAVLEIKKYEALVALSNGKASKIIVPTDAVNMTRSNVIFSETTGLGDTTPQGSDPVKEKKADPCCDK